MDIKHALIFSALFPSFVYASQPQEQPIPPWMSAISAPQGQEAGKGAEAPALPSAQAPVPAPAPAAVEAQALPNAAAIQGQAAATAPAAVPVPPQATAGDAGGVLVKPDGTVVVMPGNGPAQNGAGQVDSTQQAASARVPDDMKMAAPEAQGVNKTPASPLSASTINPFSGGKRYSELLDKERELALQARIAQKNIEILRTEVEQRRIMGEKELIEKQIQAQSAQLEAQRQNALKSMAKAAEERMNPTPAMPAQPVTPPPAQASETKPAKPKVGKAKKVEEKPEFRVVSITKRQGDQWAMVAVGKDGKETKTVRQWDLLDAKHQVVEITDKAVIYQDPKGVKTTLALEETHGVLNGGRVIASAQGAGQGRPPIGPGASVVSVASPEELKKLIDKVW